MDASISRYGALIVPLGAILLVELLAPKAMLRDMPLEKQTIDVNLDSAKDKSN
jgi:hypothetical protein